MDLGFTADEEAFRQEVRDWLDHNLPEEWRHKGVGGYREEEEPDVQRQWQGPPGSRLPEAGVAEGQLRRPDHVWRPDLLPGLQRARRRHRPRRPAHARRAR